MSSPDFEEFSRTLDLHNLSHRALVRELIPRWLRNREKDLDLRIAGAAYGETPIGLQNTILDLLDLTPEDSLLDLGAGAAGLLSTVLERGLKAWGIEQNPRLVEAGRQFLEYRKLDPESLLLGDFLHCQWPPTTTVFSTTSRFGEETLRQLIPILSGLPSLRAVVALGKPLALSGDWQQIHRSPHQVTWNRGEPAVTEELLCWVRKDRHHIY